MCFFVLTLEAFKVGFFGANFFPKLFLLGNLMVLNTKKIILFYSDHNSGRNKNIVFFGFYGILISDSELASNFELEGGMGMIRFPVIELFTGIK